MSGTARDLVTGALMGVVGQLLGGRFLRRLLVLPLEWLVRRGRGTRAGEVEAELLDAAKQDLGLPVEHTAIHTGEEHHHATDAEIR